ncbi:MAG: DUF374 domain-containing protein [Planctomycetes bacterium]|nr:DUF374 domain-containing protein [Planctomycetota bacterium]
MPDPSSQRKRSLRRRLRKWIGKRLAALAARAIPPLYYGYMSIVWATSDIRHAGYNLIVRARTRHEGLIAALWHENICFIPFGFREVNVTALVSLSDSGELFANLLRICNYEVIRGGSSRGKSRKRSVLPEIERNFRENRHVAFGNAVDGASGPPHVMKRGVIKLAEATGLPILAVHFASSPSFRLPTWDRTRIPLPFGRIRILHEGPVFCPPGAGASEFERAAGEVEALIHDTASRVETWLHTGALPPPQVPPLQGYGESEARKGGSLLGPGEFMRPTPRTGLFPGSKRPEES